MNTQVDQASLGLRIALGVLFIAHSLLKIVVFTIPGTIAFFASIDLPGVLAYPVIAGELLGGVALLAGIYVRPVAVLLALISFGAILAHAGNGWVFSAPGGGWEYPLFLGVVCLVQARLGGGRYALQKSA